MWWFERSVEYNVFLTRFIRRCPVLRFVHRCVLYVIYLITVRSIKDKGFANSEPQLNRRLPVLTFPSHCTSGRLTRYPGILGRGTFFRWHCTASLLVTRRAIIRVRASRIALTAPYRSFPRNVFQNSLDIHLQVYSSGASESRRTVCADLTTAICRKLLITLLGLLSTATAPNAGPRTTATMWPISNMQKIQVS